MLSGVSQYRAVSRGPAGFSRGGSGALRSGLGPAPLDRFGCDREELHGRDRVAGVDLGVPGEDTGERAARVAADHTAEPGATSATSRASREWRPNEASERAPGEEVGVLQEFGSSTRRRRSASVWPAAVTVAAALARAKGRRGDQVGRGLRRRGRQTGAVEVEDDATDVWPAHGAICYGGWHRPRPGADGEASGVT